MMVGCGASMTLRPVEESDRAFLFALYATTRGRELNGSGWTPAQTDAFLRMQFNAQNASYRQQFPTADFLIIELAGQRIGQLYVDRREREILVVDIAFLPHQGVGLGRKLLREIFREGEETGRPVCGHVERQNPALRLFQRMGFVVTGTVGAHYRVQWTPTSARL
jgi:ribosomal protein S18 acetylase RimI-like enzyme